MLRSNTRYIYFEILVTWLNEFVWPDSLCCTCNAIVLIAVCTIGIISGHVFDMFADTYLTSMRVDCG